MIDPTGSQFSQSADRSADHADAFEPELGSLPEQNVSEADLDKVTKTGTTTVGITTTEGVVVGADMRASLGGRFVANKNVQKVEQIHPSAVLTMAGSVGGAQSFIRSLRTETNLYEARRGEQMSMKALSTLAGNFLRGGPFFAVNPLLCGIDEEGSHVYSIDPAGGVMRDDYAVTGSGMQIAYGVLERAYDEDLDQDGARQAVAQAIDAATERDTASGNGIFLAEIADGEVDIHGHQDVEQFL